MCCLAAGAVAFVLVGCGKEVLQEGPHGEEPGLGTADRIDRRVVLLVHHLLEGVEHLEALVYFLAHLGEAFLRQLEQVRQDLLVDVADHLLATIDTDGVDLDVIVPDDQLVAPVLGLDLRSFEEQIAFLAGDDSFHCLPRVADSGHWCIHGLYLASELEYGSLPVGDIFNLSYCLCFVKVDML